MDWIKILETQNLCALCKNYDDCNEKPSEHYNCWVEKEETMMEYTKGPWAWEPDTRNGGYSGITGKDGAEVLYPSHRNDGDDGDAWFDEFPNEADKNLIAAAPDMYEALKAIQEFMVTGNNLLGNRDAPYKMLQQSLAKAEGKEELVWHHQPENQPSPPSGWA